MKTKLYKVFSLASLILIFTQGNLSFAQTMMPLPTHSTVYSSMVRGYWFTAPVSFTITGLRVAPEAGTGLQYIHVMKCNGTFPIAFGSPSTAFTTLTYISGGVNNTVIPVNIQVQQGDQIGILGTAGQANSYSASSIHTSTISGQTVTLSRLGYQGDIDTGPAPNYWGVDPSTSGQISRVFMYYVTSQPTDAGLTTFVFPNDTICSGDDSVFVRLKNFGPNSLASVDVNWKVNDVSQTTFSWSGNLASGDSANIKIGTYNFLADSTYNVVAYTSTPNNAADTVNNNDTIIKTGIHVNTRPNASVMPPGTITICQNDSLLLTANTDSGLTYQWYKDGLPLTGETDSFLYAKQAGNYQVVETNSVFCSAMSNTVIITLTSAPPAIVSAQGDTIFCIGDSVLITANTGGGLTYQWKKDGVNIPGATNWAYSAKQTGAYTVVTTNPAFCSATSSAVNVTVITPPVDLGTDQNICENQQIALDAGAGLDSYLWSTGDTTQTIVVDSSGFGGIGNSLIFSVTVTQQSCTNTDAITLTLVDCTGIPENSETNEIVIYPIPSSGIINIKTPESIPEFKISIYDLIGKIIYIEEVTSQTETIKTIDLSDSPKGIYFIRLRSDQKQHFTKFILQ